MRGGGGGTDPHEKKLIEIHALTDSNHGVYNVKGLLVYVEQLLAF